MEEVAVPEIVLITTGMTEYEKAKRNHEYLHDQVEKLLLKYANNQGTIEWHKERFKRLTASDIDAVLNIRKYKTRQSVFKSKTMPFVKSKNNYNTLHGITYENEAISRFEEKYDKKVYRLGLVEHESEPWLGASPDGICCTGELIEVKCPTSRKILAEYPLGCPEEYYCQVQMQLFCCNLNECFFIQYKPAFGVWTDEQLLVTTVKRNPKWWEESLPRLREFWNEVLLFRQKYIDWQKINYHELHEKEKIVAIC